MLVDDLFNPNPDGSDRLKEGFYLLKKHRSGRVSVPLRIWFGPPEDPETVDRPIAERTIMDRSPRWQIEINGVLAGDPECPACISGRPVELLEDIWPVAKGEPIERYEYEYRVARAAYAEQYDPNDPFGGTGAKIDPMTATLPFLEA